MLLMASPALAQSFCSDLDGVVKLAPEGFQPILDIAGRGPVETAVTRKLPGASQCWYENASGSYWCEWDAPSSRMQNQVKQLASAIGQCYDIPESETTPAGDDDFVVINLPNAVSIYVNGAADIVALSIGVAKNGLSLAKTSSDSLGTIRHPRAPGREPKLNPQTAERERTQRIRDG
jgi:hypothetical protein